MSMEVVVQGFRPDVNSDNDSPRACSVRVVKSVVSKVRARSLAVYHVCCLCRKLCFFSETYQNY